MMCFLRRIKKESLEMARIVLTEIAVALRE